MYDFTLVLYIWVVSSTIKQILTRLGQWVADAWVTWKRLILFEESLIKAALEVTLQPEVQDKK